MEDAEDAVQQACLYYLLYQNSLDVSNPERTLNWLVKQEAFRILKKRNGIFKTRTVKTISYEDLALENFRGEDVVSQLTDRFSYNLGEYTFDQEILSKAMKLYKYRINPKNLKTKYLLGSSLITENIVSLNNPTQKSEKKKLKNLIFETVVRVHLINEKKKDGREYKYYRIKKV